MIFSWADVNYNGDENGAIMRWAPVLNIQSALNYDVAKSFGLFTGLAIRNVGYIYNNYVDREGYTVKKKFRTYNIGIPVGIKVGNLDKLFIYAGYDFAVRDLRHRVRSLHGRSPGARARELRARDRRRVRGGDGGAKRDGGPERPPHAARDVGRRAR